MKISIVIPTFNRPERLSRVIDYIFASEIGDDCQSEVIVVDDGSQPPAEDIIKEKKPPEAFTLRYVWQENAGPAAARNHGFRLASGEIVLCVDDDILLAPDALDWHLRAHKEKSGSVIFGQCIFEPEAKASRSQKYLQMLSPKVETSSGLIPQSIIASGQISFEKAMFDSSGPYRTDLRTPAAEEYELSYRLWKRNIPVYMESRALGIHLVSGNVEDKCMQEYKYGIAIGELYHKVPELREFEAYTNLIAVNVKAENHSASQAAKLKKSIKSLLSTWPGRALLKATGKMLTEINAPAAITYPILRAAYGTYLFAGVNEGLKKFK